LICWQQTHVERNETMKIENAITAQCTPCTLLHPAHLASCCSQPTQKCRANHSFLSVRSAKQQSHLQNWPWCPRLDNQSFNAPNVCAGDSQQCVCPNLLSSFSALPAWLFPIRIQKTSSVHLGALANLSLHPTDPVGGTCWTCAAGG